MSKSSNPAWGSNEVLHVTKIHSSTEQATALARWNGIVDISSRNPRPRFLLGTISMFNRGHNLARALSISIGEPQWKTHVEVQAFGRIYRQGQKNSPCFCYLLYAKHSRHQKKVWKKNWIKKGFSKRISRGK